MPIPQTRMKNLLDSALALKRLIEEFKLRAEQILDSESADGRALAILISETSIPEEVLEILITERARVAANWKRNEANARALRRRRAGDSDPDLALMDDDE